MDEQTDNLSYRADFKNGDNIQKLKGNNETFQKTGEKNNVTTI